MKRRYIVVGLGVIAALVIAVPVLGVTNTLSGPTKKAIKKEVATQIAKLKLPLGPNGEKGAPGERGAPGEQGIPGKDGKDALTEDEVFTNHVTINPADGATPTTVLTLPGGFLVNCYSNGTNNSIVKVENTTTTWAGTVTYNESGTALETFGVGNHVGGGALLGSDVFGTASYQIMDTATEAAPTRIWDITVSIIRNSSPAQISGGPHCIAEAISGPA